MISAADFEAVLGLTHCEHTALNPWAPLHHASGMALPELPPMCAPARAEQGIEAARVSAASVAGLSLARPPATIHVRRRDPDAAEQAPALYVGV